MKVIIGQEVICLDGLGRVHSFGKYVAGTEWVKVDTYVDNRSCQWDRTNVTLIDPNPDQDASKLILKLKRLVHTLKIQNKALKDDCDNMLARYTELEEQKKEENVALDGPALMKFKVDDIVRYGEGNTELMQIVTIVSLSDSRLGMRYYGFQCIGSTCRAYQADCVATTERDMFYWDKHHADRQTTIDSYRKGEG